MTGKLAKLAGVGLLCSAGALWGQQTGQTTGQQTEVVVIPESFPVPASTANDQARFLSGLRVDPSSPLAPIQSQGFYLDHARAYSTSWKRFDENYFSKMRSWAAAEVIPRTGVPRAVFYLFGGPDFINVFALFPDAEMYILGGLEPVGSIVPPERLTPEQIQAGLANLRQSTSVTLNFSHFITKDMKVELEQTEFKGVLPILLSFVALGGGRIESLGFFGIDARGNVLAMETGAAAPGFLPGVRIVFRRSAELPPQTLVYVKADLSDGGVKSNPGLLTWMKQAAPAVSYLKAASFLLHEPYFSQTRSFLLESSSAILQDDSGIPVRAFLPGDWQLVFFGHYSGVLGIFEKYFQPDLEKMFQMGENVFGLPFGTGYKWKQEESSLMLAVRKRVPAATAAPTSPGAPATPAATPPPPQPAPTGPPQLPYYPSEI